jgi:hypothetical protein
VGIHRSHEDHDHLGDHIIDDAAANLDMGARGLRRYLGSLRVSASI